ncbi:ROK family transcriptional regulator [Asticcacaulis sp. AND118]|uniref:ROK family transcriptional regulator n=1 Tax=Asticcacaulis sp. AND118 TaxID=2840468 RepID=UPI001CFF9A2B|nr:ROK family transcriptional regulator [Asticcacaulis sp. AND118]UDF03628.1 ROK family transcriptional regulator [Asticcacaulis sp. AND118]
MFPHLTHGHRKVLEALVRHGTAARGALAKASGYTRPAVTNLVRDLMDWGLVEEDNGAYVHTGRRGQPQKPVSLRSGAAYAFGIGFTAGALDLVAMDLGGRVVGRARTPLAEPTPRAVLEAVQQQLESAYGKSHVVRWRQLGVGIGVPADLPPEQAQAWNLAYRREELIGYFANNLDGLAFIEAEPLACGIGERVFGAGGRYQTYLIVHIGLEIGGALFIEGRPFRGGQGGAGQIGQFFSDGPAPDGRDLMNALTAAGFGVSDLSDLDILPEAAQSVIDDWTVSAAARLSAGLAKLSPFLSPDAIILTGRLSPAILTALAEAIRLGDGAPVVEASRLGAFQTAIGAAALPVFCNLLPQG